MTVAEVAIGYFALLDYWEQFRSVEAWERLWIRTAALCRYGHIGYEAAMAMPIAESRALCWALDRLLEEERKSIPSNDD